MNVVNRQDDVIPLLEEVARVEKRTIETGRVKITIGSEDTNQRVLESLLTERVDVTRKPVGHFIDAIPPTRQDGDVTIIPLVEEVLVKRLYFREEIHIERRREVSPLDETVILRRQTASVERAVSNSTLNPQSGEQK